MDSSQNDPLFAYDSGDPYITGMAHDLTRSLKRKPFWVMEQQCGHVNWGTYNSGVRPGTTRLWTWHALACGASAVIYFRWRACLYAQEQYHSGLLQHDASPGVGYEDVQRLQGERELLNEIASQPEEAARTAILFDFADLWALQIQPHRKDFHYLRHLFVFYQALQELGLAVDLVQPGSDLSGYRLVVAPSLHLADERLAARLEGYVRNGGRLLLGVRSGFKTPSNRVTDQPLPGALSSLCGVVVQRWQALPPGVGYSLAGRVPGLEGLAQVWVEWLQPAANAGTQALAAYQDGPYAGGAALTGRHLGEGIVFSLGFYPTPQQARALMDHLAQQAGLETNGALPRGVIARRRGEYWLLLNFCEESRQVEVGGRVIQLAGRDVCVIRASQGAEPAI
jgi:beta-galactosidase